MITLEQLRSFQGALKEANLKTKVVEAVGGAVRGAKGRAREAAHDLTQEAIPHAKEIGSAMGEGISRHAEPVGEAMGRGMGQHFTRAGQDLVEGSVQGAKRLLKSRKVQAGLAAGGALYAGAKGYGAFRQHKRDKTQESIAQSLRALARKE